MSIRFPVVGKWPRRFTTGRETSARDWHVLLLELGPRAVEALRRENVYPWMFR